MGEITQGVSWIAVIVSFILSFILGWIWYSPGVFGKKWAEGVGVSLEDADKMPVFAMLIQALGTFCLAWLVGVFASGQALMTFILVLVTLILIIVANGKFAQKSNAAVAIEGSFILAMGIVMFLCQAIL